MIGKDDQTAETENHRQKRSKDSEDMETAIKAGRQRIGR